MTNAARQEKTPTMKLVPIKLFGRDHWSTLLYLETRAVDGRGLVDHRKMRCNPERHPEFAHISWRPGDEKKYATRLADGTRIPAHDDWDCAEDLVAAGFLHFEAKISAAVRIKLTDLGFVVAHQLRRHLAMGGGTINFQIAQEAPCR